MKFKVITTKVFYSDKKQIRRLKKIGFIFEQDKNFVIQDNFIIKYNPIIEIETLEELIQFLYKYGEVVINTNTIEIYNDYRE